MTLDQRKLLVFRIEGVLVGVRMFFREKPHYQQPHFLHRSYLYYALRFSANIVNVARDHFDICLWFFFGLQGNKSFHE